MNLKQTFGKRRFSKPYDPENPLSNISDNIKHCFTQFRLADLSGRTLVEPPQSRWLVGLEKHM